MSNEVLPAPMQNLCSIHPWILAPSSTKTPGAFWVAAGQSVGLKPRRASTNPHKSEDSKNLFCRMHCMLFLHRGRTNAEGRKTVALH